MLLHKVMNYFFSFFADFERNFKYFLNFLKYCGLLSDSRPSLRELCDLTLSNHTDRSSVMFMYFSINCGMLFIQAILIAVRSSSFLKVNNVIYERKEYSANAFRINNFEL